MDYFHHMIKILSSKQIKELDEATIKQEPIASIDLMERACETFVTWFSELFDTDKKIGIVCGTGNNGGDGLGIARLLNDSNYNVMVWVVRGSVVDTENFKINLQRLKSRIEIYEIVTASDSLLFKDCDIVIDAIFGSGLSRTPEGMYANAIRDVNQTDAIRIAVDIPSGLMADKPSSENIIQAHYTVSFQLPKLAFFFPSNYCYTGHWFLIDIGLDKKFLKQIDTSHFYLTLNDAKKILRPRSTFDNKGHYGHALLVAGSYGSIGAAILAARSILRSGVGRLTIHSPTCGYSILQSSVPEAMVSVDDHEKFITIFPLLTNYATVGIGPGLGQANETVEMLRKILIEFGKPMVIDADALNILSSHRELLSLVPAGSILTPHPKEFERLVGAWANDFERLEKQKALAHQLKSIIVLKGAYTSIVSWDGVVYFNSTGNPGMATGGSGDVLTGILTSLLAQGYDSLNAALLGVYLHGLSGDIAAREVGMNSLIASDIINYLHEAFKK